MLASLQASVAILARALESRQKNRFFPADAHRRTWLARQTFSRCTEEQRVKQWYPMDGRRIE